SARKLRAPTSKLQRNFKLQTPIGASAKRLVHGDGCFSGCWSLEFGAYDLTPGTFVIHRPSCAEFFFLRSVRRGRAEIFPSLWLDRRTCRTSCPRSETFPRGSFLDATWPNDECDDNPG